MKKRRMKKRQPDDPLMRGFAERLRAERMHAHYETRKAFATDLGIDAPRYRKYERGEAVPPLDVLASIVRLTGCSLDWLLIGKKPAQKGHP